MNKINISITFLLVYLSTMAMAQTKSFEQAFVALPQSYIPLLDAKKRTEIMATVKDTSTYEIRNNFGKAIKILHYDSIAQAIKIKVSENASYEFRKLNYEQKTLFCLIRTITSQPSASQVFFFDEQLQALKLKIEMPEAMQWIKTNGTALSTELMNIVNQQAFIAISFSSTNTILFENNLLHVLTLEQKKQLEAIFETKIIRDLSLTLSH